MIERRHTSPAHLAIIGGSNGGLLMGAAFTQRPELFRAVVSYVGIYDMLRVELDPNGAFNVTEFGTVESSTQLQPSSIPWPVAATAAQIFAQWCLRKSILRTEVSFHQRLTETAFWH